MRHASLFLVILIALLTIGVFFLRAQADGDDPTRYAEMCEAQIAPLPAFDCADGTVVPITVDGKTPRKFTPHMTCDRPALLDNGQASDGQCVPYSRILNLSVPDFQMAVMCRQKHIRDEEAMLFDEIDVIAHKPQTGATCWFQAKGDGRDKPVSGRNVPSPTSAAGVDFFKSPEAVAADGCGNCHDNDAFMYSPFVGQVWSEMPTSPFGPYYHVGGDDWFKDWKTVSITPRDNTCVGCHRMGTTTTCGALTDWMTGISVPKGANERAASFPLSHAMPVGQTLTHPEWTVIHAQSVSQIRACCEDPDQPMCNAAPISSVQK